ncbi:hypothetical protein VaNZ11_006497 [Volvox africanus]|uniref:Uncharacterized protein n=1 Tax=Volvox africanus TaxID=51714 RepID=A0ABQ5S0V7_9CHLO|nr:hypothetical protein VaNZ11_006497 [Volvox africanus]
MSMVSHSRVVALVFMLEAWIICAVGADEANMLRSCWNAKYNPTPIMFEEWISGHPARLYMVDAWWSSRRNSIPLTIFTMMSLDRLSMLESQCRGYIGPISAAVYIPLVLERDPSLGSDFKATSDHDDGVERHGYGRDDENDDNYGDGDSDGGEGDNEVANVLVGRRRHIQGGYNESHTDPVALARAKLQNLFHLMEAEAARAAGNNSLPGCCCQLRLMLYAERMSDSPLATIMPTNSMRNAAMLGATTPLSAMFDADLAPCTNINDLVQNASWVQYISKETTRPSICIPPAWETRGHLQPNSKNVVVQRAITGIKADVLDMWARSELQVFQVNVCKHCHKTFDHSRWAKEDMPYTVQHTLGFEPWGILWRLRDPGYDERFRGWLYDKQTHVEALARKHRYTFTVLPDLWVVHRPHKKVGIVQLYRRSNTTGEGSREVEALLRPVVLSNGKNTTVYTAYRHYMDSMRRTLRSALASRQPYEPQQNAQFLHCKSVLPWWQQG